MLIDSSSGGAKEYCNVTSVLKRHPWTWKIITTYHLDQIHSCSSKSLMCFRSKITSRRNKTFCIQQIAPANQTENLRRRHLSYSVRQSLKVWDVKVRLKTHFLQKFGSTWSAVSGGMFIKPLQIAYYSSPEAVVSEACLETSDYYHCYIYYGYKYQYQNYIC